MNIKEKIIIKLEEVVKELTNEDISSKGRWASGPKIQLSRPSDESHGDYSCNIAMRLARQLGKNPLEIAQEIADKFLQEPSTSSGTNSSLSEQGESKGYIEKIEAVAPGFINFYLSKETLIQQAEEVLSNPKNVGKSTTMQGNKVMIEFTDPNPFKEFHIGHLYSNIVGESLSRLLESQGAEVKRVTYQGDVGLHVAKSLWGVSQLIDQIPAESTSSNEKAAFLGKAYALGATKYEEEQAAKEQIIIINQKVYSREDEEINHLYDQGKQWSLDYFQQIYARLGTDFWRNYFESEAGPKGVKIVKDHIKDGIFEEHDGAVVFRGEKFGLHTRVFINSLGLPTYEAKELGLAPTKYFEYPYDLSIIVTGNEINEYFKVLLKVLFLVNPDLASKTKHISHGMVRLPEGKMSSRTGKVITGEWLLDEAYKKASNLTKHTLEIEEDQAITASYKIGESALHHGMKASELMNSTEQIATGSIKYAFLKSGIGRDLEFDFETSLNLQGNSGPYVQYTYTRTHSILEKAEKGLAGMHYPKDYTPEEEELSILCHIQKFPEIVEEAAITYSPNVITEYLFTLSQMFNNFYQKYRILQDPSQGHSAQSKEDSVLSSKRFALSDDEQSFRLALTATVGIVIKQGLNLLGIHAPEKM